MLGESYRRWGNFGDATLAYERAVILAPDEVEYNQSLARSYRKTGRVEDAVRSYEKALALDPDNEALAQELAQLRSR